MIYLNNSELNWKLEKGAPCCIALTKKGTVHEGDMSHIQHLPYSWQVIITQYKNVPTVGSNICHRNAIL